MKAKKDYLNELREALRSYHAIEQELITTNPEFREGDMENYSDSYKYLLLQVPDEQLQNPSNMIALGVEDFPNDVLAGILLKVLKSKVPMVDHIIGLGIDRIGNTFRFCISGSVSLEEVQTLCEQHQRIHGR